jgi:putative ABC transport system permease protein
MIPFRRRSARLARMLRISLELLAAHKLRTLLSVSGLCVGVATVIVMGAVGEGAERRVVAKVRAMGSDFLSITSAPAPRVAGRERQVATLTALRAADAAAIAEESAFAAAAAPVVSRTLIVKVGARNSTVLVSGTTVEGLQIRRIRVRSGRPFEASEDRERRRVAMLGPTVSSALFEEADPVGREIRINAVPFEVVGVMAARGTDVGGTDLDNEIVIPLETAMRRLLNVPYVHAILVQAHTASRLDALERDARATLLRRHPVRGGDGGIEPFVVQNQSVLLRTERGAARAINRMIVAVATLALLVGGIGIAAVMLLSVRQRTREIGLRRAIGARRSDISMQFLLEAALLSAAGGLAGVAAGLLVAFTASLLGPWDLAFPFWAVLAGIGVSTLLGFMVGAIPASRAARLDPSVALRS